MVAMQVRASGKDDKTLSLKEVYGEKLGSFLEANENCYKSWNRSESPENLWKTLQEEKENYLYQLVSSGLRFSEEVQNEVDWKDMMELLQKSELSFEYPFSLPFNSNLGSDDLDYSSSEIYSASNQFSPKWGINAGKTGKARIDPRRVSENLKKKPFEMDERQWQIAGYEIVLLSIDFIQRNIGELKLQITRLEEKKLKMDRIEEQNKSCNSFNKRSGSALQSKFSNINEEKTQNYHFSRLCTEQGMAYEILQSQHSKLTRDYENLLSIHNSLNMFSEMVRIKFRIDSSTDYLVGKLLSRFDTGGMGFLSYEHIHPLETRYRVLLLLESWSKSDLFTTNPTTWEYGKLRIKPGGAPRIVPELSNSKLLKDDPEFRSWVHRQIHIIYSNLAFKLQRLLLFIPPGWLQYLPAEIDLIDMLNLTSKSWSFGSRNIGLGIQKELLSKGIKTSFGQNPQYILEFAIESISILDQLRNLIEFGFWGDLSYLKAPENQINGRDLLNRLLQLMSAMERLDLAIRRDISQNSFKSLPCTFHINLSSFCIEAGNTEKTSKSLSSCQNKQDGHIYTFNQPILTSNSSQAESKKYTGHINKRQLIYSNELVRDSIEERLMALPKLNSYWMFEPQILHIFIKSLMSVNVNLNNAGHSIKAQGLTSMGIHPYSPFISRCIVFIGYLLENGIFIDEDLEYMSKVTITKTNVIPTSLDTYSLYLASSIWVCYENFLSSKNLKGNSDPNQETGSQVQLFGLDVPGSFKVKESQNSSIQEIFFSILDLILKNLPGYLKHQTVSSLEEEMMSSTQALTKGYFSTSQSSTFQKSTHSNSEGQTVSKDPPLSKQSGSNIRSRFHSNSRELLRKFTNSKDLTKSAISVEKSEKDNKEEELDEDLALLNRFYKINSFITQIQGKNLNSGSNFANTISQPIFRQTDQLWKSPDWMISLGEDSKRMRNSTNKETVMSSLNDQIWKVFGISLTTCSRLERIYGEILVRRLNTLSFRSRILYLCQNFFKLGSPGILRRLLQIASRTSMFLVLEEDESITNIARRSNIGQIGSDKRLWTRYCNYCILRSNEVRIRELFEIPMQMLKLPATHYVELKLRQNSSDLRESEEKERMERLARQEIQGCLETFINSFKFLEDVYIPETITGWSKVMYEGGSLIVGGGSISLVRDYVLITVRLLEVYVPYYLQELISSEYWDLLMISKSQFEDLVSSMIAVDKYMVILKNWLEFNLDSIKVQSRIIDAQMIYNQSNNDGSDLNSQMELRLQEMMKRRYMNDHLQQVTLLNIFSPQFILLIQNRINNIEYLVYKVYQSNKDLNSNSWMKGINTPEIYTSSIMIDIGTIVNTGVESLVEWLTFPLEDEQSMTLCLSPIMKFYRDLTAFIVNTIKREMNCSKYELVDSYMGYVLEILSVLCKNGVGVNGSSSLGGSVIQELKDLIKIHKIPNLVGKIFSFLEKNNSAFLSTGVSNNTGIGNNMMNASNIGGGGAITCNNSGDTLGIGFGNSRSSNGSWNRSKSKAIEGGGGMVSDFSMIAEKFERGSIFFSLLNLCLSSESEERGMGVGGGGGGIGVGVGVGMGGGGGIVEGIETESRANGIEQGEGVGRFRKSTKSTNIMKNLNCEGNNIHMNMNNNTDSQDLKCLVSIHNLFFFKNIIFETCSKFFNLFFGNVILASQDEDEDHVHDLDHDHDHDQRYRIKNQSSSKNLKKSKKKEEYSREFGKSLSNVIESQQYKLADEVLMKMKKMLEFLRSYGAMDNDENKLLASETANELNRLLFSQGNNSIFSDPTILERHRNLFLNLIQECIQSIDSLIIYILRMYCIKTISCTFGMEFYLRIYSTGLLNEIQNNKKSYSYTSSYEEEAALSLESLIPGLNSFLRDFLSQCPNQQRPENQNLNIYDKEQEENGGIFSFINKGISTPNHFETELNKEYIRTLELLWLSHIFQLSLTKSNQQSSYLQEILPLFEYDFEILDELRRSTNVNDFFISSSHINKESKQTFVISDIILYFITQLLPNTKLFTTQHQIFKDLTLISNLNSDDLNLIHQKEKNPSQNSSNSKSKFKTKNYKIFNENFRYPFNQDLNSEIARAPHTHAEIKQEEIERKNLGLILNMGNISGGFDSSMLSKQLSKGPTQFVSKIIKSSNSGQKKIRKFISRNLYH